MIQCTTLHIPLFGFFAIYHVDIHYCSRDQNWGYYIDSIITQLHLHVSFCSWSLMDISQLNAMCFDLLLCTWWYTLKQYLLRNNKLWRRMSLAWMATHPLQLPHSSQTAFAIASLFWILACLMSLLTTFETCHMDHSLLLKMRWKKHIFLGLLGSSFSHLPNEWIILSLFHSDWQILLLDKAIPKCFKSGQLHSCTFSLHEGKSIYWQ